ncbi:putative peptidase [Candidatus Rubidus massiliensis]|nr:putative peptidase [Candidatus Rubidus massiliensis]
MFNDRIQRLRQLYMKNGLEGFYIDDPLNIYYLTGLSMSAGQLFITNEKVEVIVDSRYFDFAKAHSPFKVYLDNQYQWESVQKIGFDSNLITFNRYLLLEKVFGQKNFIPIENALCLVRMIKDNEEIALLKEAANLGSLGFERVIHSLKEGITEEELALELEIFWKRNGAQGLGFNPIIAFGKNGAMPHYRPGKAKLEKGMSVLIDIGVLYKHYHSDMTRVVFYDSIDPLISHLYDIVLEAQEKAIQSCKPGITIQELDQTARQFIEHEGFGPQFIHNLGHGLGLEIHECPFLKTKEPFSHMVLKPGMVITIEPGIYIADKGGVRIEDTILITENGYENLTNTQKQTKLIIK